MSVDPYTFISDSLPADHRFLPPLANGLLGWRVYNNTMHMGGVYNGGQGQCHRADVPCPFAVTVETEEAGKDSYSLDTNIGVFTHTLTSSSATISQSFYVHRHHANLMVMEIVVVRHVTTEVAVTVKLDTSFVPQSKDIDFHNASEYRGGSHIQGRTHTAEFPEGPRPTVHLIWTPIPSTLTLPPGKCQDCWGFLLAVSDSLDVAESSFDEGLDLMATGCLRRSHENAWEELWLCSKVEVKGSEKLLKAVIGCMFYILSAFPSSNGPISSFSGVSPGGLSNGCEAQDYWGHVFWDQEIWIIPTVALFYPKLARVALEYRMRTIDGAKYNAQKQGYEGLKLAWESAVSGREMCPEDVYGQREIHINGDVVLAFRNYYYLTEDLSMFTDGQGSQVIWGVADYWVSRVTWSPDDQKYHLLSVMPPDEYYDNVNNSVYTNTVAKLSLQFAVELADFLQHPVPKEWQDVADNLQIPFDQECLYHPEFEGYTKGYPVKQADTVMLSYPLGLSMSPEVRRNDLEAYEIVTDPYGPAMTWTMFAIGWLELSEPEKAQRLLEKCYKNIQGPFQVWSESSDGSGAVNFLTGMGGFLQAVVFGYSGFRVQKDCLVFSPLLPQNLSELCIHGVSYLGHQLDWLFWKDEVCVTLRPQEGGGTNAKVCDLQVVLKASGTKLTLTPGMPVTFPREPGFVCKLELSSFCWPF